VLSIVSIVWPSGSPALSRLCSRCVVFTSSLSVSRSELEAQSDADDIPDLAIVIAEHYPDPAFAAVLFGNGDGTFAPLQPIPFDFDLSVLRLGDVNGDGHTDLVAEGATYPLALYLQVELGNPNGGFTKTPLYVPPAPLPDVLPDNVIPFRAARGKCIHRFFKIDIRKRLICFMNQRIPYFLQYLFTWSTFLHAPWSNESLRIYKLQTKKKLLRARSYSTGVSEECVPGTGTAGGKEAGSALVSIPWSPELPLAEGITAAGSSSHLRFPKICSRSSLNITSRSSSRVATAFNWSL